MRPAGGVEKLVHARGWRPVEPKGTGAHAETCWVQRVCRQVIEVDVRLPVVELGLSETGCDGQLRAVRGPG